jgi:uncharacterized protein YndB with AHSA1/START domain
MPQIQHEVGIHAPIERVQASFATLEGLAEFWTTTVEGDPGAGGKLDFWFGGTDPSAVMEVLEVTPARIVWRCISGPDEWVGTIFTFALTARGDETVVFFTNTGWREAKAFMGHCSTKWGYFLLGLKQTLEGAEPVAFPNDIAISGWEERSRAHRTSPS